MATLVAPDVVAAADWRQQRWRPIPTFDLPAMRWWVHHGAGGDATLRTLLGYERYHVQTKGWRALGYSFAIGLRASGKAVIWVARGWGGVGAHTQGDNDESHGVVLVGDWTRGTVPQPMVGALAWLILRGEEVGAGPREITGGHRNAPGAQTRCPGNAGMAAMRSARELIHRSAPVEPTPTPEEEETMSVDVVEVNGEVWLVDHPVAIGPVPAEHRDYYRNLAGSGKNRQYKGPHSWSRERLAAHPQRSWSTVAA